MILKKKIIKVRVGDTVSGHCKLTEVFLTHMHPNSCILLSAVICSVAVCLFNQNASKEIRPFFPRQTLTLSVTGWLR